MAKSLQELLPAALNQVSAIEKCKPSVTTDEQKFELAVQGPVLQALPEEDLKEVLRYVFWLIGLRPQNVPNEEEKAYLHSYILQHYGMHTPAEVRLAFEMAVQQKLDVDPTVFEHFTPTYLGQIMGAYRTWAGKQLRTLSTRNLQERVYTEQEKADIEWEYWCVTTYERLQKINKRPCRLRLKVSRKAQSETPSKSAETSTEPKAPE